MYGLRPTAVIVALLAFFMVNCYEDTVPAPGVSTQSGLDLAANDAFAPTGDRLAWFIQTSEAAIPAQGALTSQLVVPDAYESRQFGVTLFLETDFSTLDVRLQHGDQMFQLVEPGDYLHDSVGEAVLRWDNIVLDDVDVAGAWTLTVINEDGSMAEQNLEKWYLFFRDVEEDQATRHYAFSHNGTETIANDWTQYQASQVEAHAVMDVKQNLEDLSVWLEYRDDSGRVVQEWLLFDKPAVDGVLELEQCIELTDADFSRYPVGDWQLSVRHDGDHRATEVDVWSLTFEIDAQNPYAE